MSTETTASSALPEPDLLGQDVSSSAAALARFCNALPVSIDHVLVTAGDPSYGPLLEMSADHVRTAVSDHVVLGLELAPVRVNLIAAGFVDTLLSASLGDRLDARREELRSTLQIGRDSTQPA
jgi:hypothetical protein